MRALPMPRARVRPRVVFVVLVAVYFASFIVTYDLLLQPYQGFWGFGRPPVPWEYDFFSWVLALLPALWCPLELRRPSQLLFLFQYLVMFVPATWVLFRSALPPLPPHITIELLLAMFAGLALMQITYVIPLLRLPRVVVTPRAFWTAFYLLSGVFAVGIFVVLGRNLQFKGIAAIYTLRFDAADLLEASGLGYAWYAVGWFGAVFLPVAFAHAMRLKSIALAALVTAGYVFLFGITGTKTALLAVVILWMLSRVVHQKGAGFAIGFAAGLGCVLLLPFAFDPFGDTGELLQKWYVLFVHTRVFGVPQLLVGQYYGFFAQHPLTWWSHINGVNAFVNDPYSIDVARLLGYFYYEGPVGLNGGMWAQDGVGAAGIGGVLLVSVVGAFVLWVFDAMSARVSPAFVALASAVVAISFMNVPLTTTLVTGGMGLVAVAMYLMPPDVPADRAGDGS
jgi:hypothetical protein